MCSLVHDVSSCVISYGEGGIGSIEVQNVCFAFQIFPASPFPKLFSLSPLPSKNRCVHESVVYTSLSICRLGEQEQNCPPKNRLECAITIFLQSVQANIDIQ